MKAGQNSNTSKLLCMSLLPARMKKIQSKSLQSVHGSQRYRYSCWKVWTTQSTEAQTHGRTPARVPSYKLTLLAIGSGELINHIKFHEKSKTRTRQMECVAWQLEIPGKPNDTTEIRSKRESPVAPRWAKQQTKN